MSEVDEAMYKFHIRDAVNALLDALSAPDGRHVAHAWNEACLLFGRYGAVMKRAAFEQYLDELASSGGTGGKP